MKWIDPKVLELLKQNMKMSSSTWHKVMNPLCGKCIAKRGKQ